MALMPKNEIKRINEQYVNYFEPKEEDISEILDHVNQRTFLEKIRLKKLDRESVLYGLAIEPLEQVKTEIIQILDDK